MDSFIMATGSWNLRDSAGCELDDGVHLLVVTQPDYALVSTHTFTYEGEDTGQACRTANQDRTNVQFSVNGMEIHESGSLDEHMSFNLRLDNQGDGEFNLFWPTDCALEITLSRSVAEEENVYKAWSADCSSLSGQNIVMESGQVHEWTNLNVPFVIDDEPIENGTWLVTIQTTSIPSFVAQAAHTYNGLQLSESPVIQPIPEKIVIEENDIVIIEENSPFFKVSGDWNYVTQPRQGCWLLSDSNGEEWAFIANMKDAGWKPQPGMSGSYEVEESNAAGDCSVWSGIVILSTIQEDVPIITAKPSQTTDAESSDSPSEVVIQNAPTAAAVVATTSLSILILLYVGNTEWIRIPALQLGIGLIGMVRRAREHDGEYQRGRIMGYLTANPGVHFRALLGALEMSNGQLTHHLKNLQGEERIWRRKDGRLVRFYPASIQQNTDEDDLPVPLLTPDPNSLQGKILRLLDATENDIVNLSQKELAHRLKASQQLVSHHLRTLQKFGLIEREKVGMRYRYQLTREAIFLVNSSEYTVDTE
jgi:DNA-binding MarR family transcriptional regulator